MSEVFAWVTATFVTIPILAFYLVYIVTVKTTRNKKKSMKLAIDVSTLFFIFSVLFLANEIWAKSFFWLILICIIVIAMIFTIYYWKVAEDIELMKLIRGIWRFNFLVFFFIYLLLSIYGLFIRLYAIPY